jgi:hypothetical protein
MWPFRRKPKPAPEAPPPAAAPEAPPEEPRPQATQPTRTADDILRELDAEAPPKTPKAPPDPGLGRSLLAEGPVTQEYLRQQIALSGRGETYLGRVLARVRAPREDKLFRLLASDYLIPEIDLKQCKIPLHIARSIPRDVALKYKVVPIDRVGDLLCIAFAGEPNPKAIEAVRRAAALRVKALRCPAHHLAIALRRLFEEQPTVEATAAVPISHKEYDEATRGPEALWEDLHATRGPVRAERIA